MRTKRLAIMFAVLGLLVALTTTAYATSSAKDSTPSLLGTWKMTIPTTGTSLELTEALQTYFADGNYIETNNNPSAGSTGHGVWIGSGNTYLSMQIARCPFLERFVFTARARILTHHKGA